MSIQANSSTLSECPPEGRGGERQPDSHELVTITLAALNIAMLRYDRLFAQCERREPLSPSDMDAARCQVERALELLMELARAVRTETAELDAMLRDYAAQWLAQTTPGGSA